MDDLAIKVENLSKQYRLGNVGTGTISHDLNRWWARIRGKEDPFLKLGDTNDRTSSETSGYVWALRDINFEIRKGEVLGIIGKNGAGKSTLLKILSKVTGPTTGRLLANGRMGTLLEVGTGFHPELTGRENVFLNGAILGMTKDEIGSKLDEIVDFSGCAKYIDTPVKRYSSGMMVRLAFSVAAFLEPEVLIVDEVLAVGDAEFRKKCIGKMSTIAGEGRTILFVSHSMDAVRNLCTRALYLENGRLTLDGSVDAVIEKYVREEKAKIDYKTGLVPKDWERPWGQEDAIIEKVQLLNSKGDQVTELLFKEPMKLVIDFSCSRDISDVNFQVRIANLENVQITRTMSASDLKDDLNFSKGSHKITLELDPKLIPNEYSFNIYLGSRDGVKFYDAIAGYYHFRVLNESIDGRHELSTKHNTFINLGAKWNFD